jgi:hypothetical protein
MLTCNRLEAGSLADGAWFFEPQASCLKLISALADGLMLVSKQPVNVFLTFFCRRLQDGAQKKNPVQIILFFLFKSNNQRQKT